MSSPEDIASLSQEELLALVVQLQRKVQELEASVQGLQTEVERLTREKKRQAAPFSKGSRVTHPKRPGRKPGLGAFSFRLAPHSSEITDAPVEVPVTQETCPGCGSRLAEERVDFAYITDIPPRPRPKVTQYWVWVCWCTACGRTVRGKHPDLASNQYGATAHRVGKRGMAAAHTLHYQFGIPVRKVPGVGAITQDALRRARGQVGAASTRVCGRRYGMPLQYTPTTLAGG
jgi:transposase